MSQKVAACLGPECEFFCLFYVVSKHGGGYIPEFDKIDVRCQHPSVYTPPRLGIGEFESNQGGAFIPSLKACPLTGKSESV